MTLITCQHCDSEIDVADDPRCVAYDPSGATDVMCAECRLRAFNLGQERSFEGWPPSLTERLREAYRIKRGWRA